jgi:hypothetical protein
VTRIDWSAVVEQLRARGMTYPQLHRCTGMPLGSLHNLASGVSAEPRHSDGERLLELLRSVSVKPEGESFRQ